MQRLPLIIQNDLSILLEVENPQFDEARDLLMGFAELVKSPEHVHTYRLSALSLWNALAAGLSVLSLPDALQALSQYPVPSEVSQFIWDQVERYGRLRLMVAPDHDGLWLTSEDLLLLNQIGRNKTVVPFLGPPLHPGYRIAPEYRGLLKQALAKIGWPVDDQAGFDQGAPLPMALSPDIRLRPYQNDAVRSFWGNPSLPHTGGNGVVALPCGAGKTIVGLGVMAEAQTHTLILTTSIASLHQWRRELLEKTSLDEESIGEYSSQRKEIKPVTLTTYQVLSHKKSGQFVHFQALDDHPWGLIIYDEVHLLPAPVFRLTASLQSRQRLGLTATLIREDGRAHEVFSLIGPKRFDMPWKQLENQGWIANATCREIRVDMPTNVRENYAMAEDSEQARIAAENPAKIGVISELLQSHADDHILIIGQYLDQLESIHQHFDAPILTGKTPVKERERLYDAFRAGHIPILIVSKVANFAIDLPDANVAIQISGTFGSRQEEAQRLGRILRPKTDGKPATFYSLVSKDSREQDYAQKRQLFLCEQGYRYHIAYANSQGAPHSVPTVIPFPGRHHG